MVLECGILWEIKRVHHCQRGRASIMGLGLRLGKSIETERLEVVVTARLVVLLIHSEETADSCST